MPDEKGTLIDVAREARVSCGVASKVLCNSNGNIRVGAATAERIREIAKKLNFQPNMLARQLARGKSDIIGVVLDSCAPAIYHDRLARMEYYASLHGYRFMIGQAHNDHRRLKKFAEDFISYNVAGIICMMHAFPGHEEEVAKAYPLDKTVYLEKAAVEHACYVTIDVEKAFHDVALYLAGRGRKRIAQLVVGGNGFVGGMESRITGVHSGLKKSGQGFKAELLVSVPVEDALNIDMLLPFVRNLVFEHGADAIIAPNDYLAAAVLKACMRLGISVPREVAVTGYDDLDFCRLLTPALTTFYDNRDLVAKSLVELLIKLINNPELPDHERKVVVSPVFVERETT